MGSRVQSDSFLLVAPSNSGKKKKNAKVGPFYFFMMDKKDEWIQDGTLSENPSMKQLVDKCKPLWYAMKTNPLLMEPYIEKASEWKKQNRNLETIFDSHGRSLADIKREATRVQFRMQQMMEEIESAVRSSGRNVIKNSFFIAHFNYLFKTERDFFIPCSASVAEFSIESGLKKTWHKFVSPLDSIPIGYKYSCISYARNTHFLTPDFDLYDKDMAGIFHSLVEFLGGDEEDLPPLYVVADHMPAADCITDFITSRAQSPIKIKVFSLNKLLQELANLPSIYIAEAFLDDTTKFNHFKGLGCDVHESLRNSNHCSLAICQRHVFNVCSACCPAYNIHPKPGKHYPQEKTITLSPKLLNLENLAIEERINRKIPTPAGVTDIPLGMGMNEDLSSSFGRHDANNDKSQTVKKIFKPIMVEPVPKVDRMAANLGAIPKVFPSRDIRENVKKPNNEAADEIPSFKPTRIKSGQGWIFHKS